MRRLLAVSGIVLFLAGCGKNDSTRATEKLMKASRERAAQRQSQSRQTQIKAKTNPEQVFPRVEKAPAAREESGLDRTGAE